MYHILWLMTFSRLYILVWVNLGEKMDFITNLFSSIDFNVIFQLTCVALIMISGPVIIFLLALRGGDL